MAQDLWQVHYQILPIIFLKELIKLNVKTNTMIKKCETFRITYKYCDCFLEYTNFKDDLIEYKCLCCNINYQQNVDEKLNQRFFNAYNFLTTIIISLFHCWKKVFILMSIWMVGINSMKHNYLKRKILIVT